MSSRSCQIVIAGNGITGLSCAFFLKKQGFKHIVMASSAVDETLSRHTPGLIAGGQLDNFTRVSHAHGSDFAAKLWHFGDLGFSSLVTWCQSHHIPLEIGRRLRFIVSEGEKVEAAKAVAEMVGYRFDVKLRPPRPEESLMDRVIAVQDEGFTGAIIPANQVLDTLEKATDFPNIGKISSIKSSNSGIESTCESGEIWRSELVVLACHLQIRTLLPTMKEALISVADQWGTINFENLNTSSFPAGTYWTANNTYEWGGVTDKSSMSVGGGRYLRKHAGIDALESKYETSIESHLQQQLAKTFSGIKSLTTTPGGAGLDCRPCDELPIIGPMFGDSRILLGTGYMGSGFTMGFKAGQCLADLIANGHSPDLPRRLWPERLRTMEARS